MGLDEDVVGTGFIVCRIGMDAEGKKPKPNRSHVQKKLPDSLRLRRLLRLLRR
jgi:hypothetical protein